MRGERVSDVRARKGDAGAGRPRRARPAGPLRAVDRAFTARACAARTSSGASTERCAIRQRSPATRRIGGASTRQGCGTSGRNEPIERGDIHIKDRATYLYDGARSWLLSAKAFEQSDGEKLINPLRDGIKGLRERCAANEARTPTVAELARAADANAGEALRWIALHAEAIDELLTGR